MSLFFSRQSAPGRREFQQALGQAGDAWYAACLRITNDVQLAQDAVQDALLKAWRKRDQFQSEARLETWIHRIAINCAIELVRTRQRANRAQLVDVPREAPALLDADVMRSEIGRDFSRALGALTELERVCFVLKHLEEWRLTEIADELDTNIGSVKQSLFRAVKKLRIEMSGLRGE